MNTIPKTHTVNDINNFITCNEIYKFIMNLKKYHNRIRPFQLLKTDLFLETKSGHTPAYPAGHAYQAWALCIVFSDKYPHLEKELTQLAITCDKVRVSAGLHYPSDGEFSKKLAFQHKNELLLLGKKYF
tara:strand:- start:369 stop:755 length:387 start_codon:yes stop_codon:yes gene_type:complete